MRLTFDAIVNLLLEMRRPGPVAVDTNRNYADQKLKSWVGANKSTTGVVGCREDEDEDGEEYEDGSR